MYEMVVRVQLQGDGGKDLNISGRSGEEDSKFNKVEDGEVRL